MPWRINFLRKARYDTNTKQKDDIYDLMNTRKGLNDSLPAAPQKLTALGLRSSASSVDETLASFYRTQTSRTI